MNYFHYQWKLIKIFFLSSCFAFATTAGASENNDPLDMLQTTSGQMIKELRENQASLKNNSVIVYQIISRVLLPHVDTIGMSRSILGRQVWNEATKNEQEQFTKEFTQLLVRTYAKAFAAYDNQEVKFLPLRESVSAHTRIQINSVILQPDGPKIPVNYRLVKLNDNWKAYDIIVDGISLLQSYKSQFAAEVSQHGLSSLIKKLQKQNENAV